MPLNSWPWPLGLGPL